MARKTEELCPKCGEPLYTCKIVSSHFGGFSYQHTWCREEDCEYHKFDPNMDCYAVLQKDIPDRLRNDLEEVCGVTA